MNTFLQTRNTDNGQILPINQPTEPFLNVAQKAAAKAAAQRAVAAINQTIASNMAASNSSHDIVLDVRALPLGHPQGMRGFQLDDDDMPGSEDVANERDANDDNGRDEDEDSESDDDSDDDSDDESDITSTSASQIIQAESPDDESDITSSSEKDDSQIIQAESSDEDDLSSNVRSSRSRSSKRTSATTQAVNKRRRTT